MSTSGPFESPNTRGGARGGGSSTLGVALVATLLGLADFLGGGCIAMGSIGPREEVPDMPFYTSSQQAALEQYIEAASSLDPVNAGIGVLVGLVGALLMAAGVLLMSGSPQRGLVGQFAFGASIVVDALQILWLAVWYVLLWDETVVYVSGSLTTLPPGMEDSIPTLTGVSVVLTVLLGAVYFGSKMAIALFGLYRARKADQVQLDPPAPAAEPSPPPPRQSEDGLDWALDEATEESPGMNDSSE